MVSPDCEGSRFPTLATPSREITAGTRDIAAFVASGTDAGRSAALPELAICEFTRRLQESRRVHALPKAAESTCRLTGVTGSGLRSTANGYRSENLKQVAFEDDSEGDWTDFGVERCVRRPP